MTSIEKAPLAVDDESAWAEIALHWHVRPDSVYLNHGSFGFTPQPVRFARRKWIDRLDEQPMDFYVRHYEDHLWNARTKLAQFVGTVSENMVFVDNATYGMNIVAESFPLQPGEEVLLNNHEYGAVHRIWERQCKRAQAVYRSVDLPETFDSVEQIVAHFVEAITDKTRLLVVSHITSATAIVLPIKEIIAAARERGVAVCVDGPHAPAQIPLNVDQLKCDFYTASCHKWLCGVLGSGFLYVAPSQQQWIQPRIKSWGRLLPAIPARWDEEFTWIGTRDPSPFLSVPAAIEFMENIGLEVFRARSRYLAEIAEQKLTELTGQQPLASRDDGWYASMVHVPLPDGDWEGLQQALWQENGIEVPIIFFENRWFIRVSFHLYNHPAQIEILVNTLKHLLNRG